MADTSELQLKITLDDGSIVQGFLNVEKKAKATGEVVAKNLDGKGKGLSTLKEGLDKMPDSFDSMALAARSSGAAIATALGPIGILITVVVAAAEAARRLAFAGEQVNAVNTQFGRVAEAAGLQVDSFKESIIGATEGLIDDEDALQIATKGIIALGAEASKLPQILDLSRGVSRTLGRDFKDTFENLSSFLEVGNARALKQYGIVLDLEKAYSAAAKEVGLTTAQLTEQQKQVIRTNLVLEELPKKFSAAAQSVTPLKDAFDRLKVSASNALEDIQSGFANFITKSFIDKADLSNVALGRIRESSKDLGNEIQILSDRINEIKTDKLGSRSVQAAAEISSLTSEIKKLREEQGKLFIEQAGRSDQELFTALENSRKVVAVEKQSVVLTDEQKAIKNENARKRAEEARKIESEFSNFVSGEEQKRLQIAIQSNELKIQDTSNNEAKLNLIKQNSIIQKSLLEEQENAQIALIQQKYRDLKLAGTYQEEQSITAIKQTFSDQRNLIAEQEAAKTKELEDQKLFNSLDVNNQLLASAGLFAQGASEAAASFANNSVKSFKQVGAQAFATLSQGVGRAFNNFGAALANGEDAGAAFAEAMGDSLLQIAGQFADMFIQVGIGKLAMSYGSDATGYAMIAAGAALKILAGAIGGKKSAGSSPSVDTGGGLGAIPGNPTTDFTPADPERQKPNTQVQLIVQGDVFDSNDTGMRLAEILNASFEKNGVVIQQGAIA